MTESGAPERFCPSCGRREHGTVRCSPQGCQPFQASPLLAPPLPGVLVRCLNCRTLWRRVTQWDMGGSTWSEGDLQHGCPACSSNAYEVESA